VPHASTSAPPDHDRAAQRYWRRNLQYVALLLALWALVSFGFGIFWKDALDAVRLPGTSLPLGFWFAQQGAIYAFLLLIVAYVALMNRLDHAHGVREE
jgi:putative solute:sodium symporter small subunit